MKIIERSEFSLIEWMKAGQFANVEMALVGTKKREGAERCFDVAYRADEVDKEGLSVLEYAIIYGRENIALLLLKEPACSFLYSHKDGNRPSPAGLAIKYGRQEVLAEMLKRQSFDPAELQTFVRSDVYQNISLLEYAVMYKNLEAVEMLLRHGAPIRINKDSGKSALSVAAIEAVGHCELAVETLIFRRLLKALAGKKKKHEVIAKAVADLQEADLKTDDPQAVGKIEMVLASADMY